MQVVDLNPRSPGDASVSPDGRFWVGKWLFDFESHRIIDGEKQTKLTLKAAGVLRELAQDPGIPVSREHLLGEVWKGTIPTDDVLSQAVSELRKALHDDPRDARYIETITKVGYRLLADVRPATPAAPARSKPARKNKSIFWISGAVLAITVAAIAYLAARPSSDNQAQREIARSPALGSDIVPVTSDPGLELYPALSPDGYSVVYSGKPLGDTQFDLFLKSPGSVAPRRLTNDPSSNDFMATWSPDGTEVAFLRLREGDCGINIASVVGGFANRVGDCMPGAISWLDWSPDGRFLAYPAFTEANPDAVQIHRLNRLTGIAEPMQYPRVSDEHDVAPRYSPDGRWLAFRRGAYPYGNLYLMPAEGGELKQLALLNSAVHGIDWLVDSSGLVFSSNHLGRDAVFELNIETLNLQLIDWRAAHGISIAATNVMAFSSNQADGNIWEYPLSATMEPGLGWFSSTRNERATSVSPDASNIAFISDRSGQAQVWLGNRHTGDLLQISNLNEGAPEAPHWSGDGRLLVYTVREPGGARVVVNDIHSGEVSTYLDQSSGLGGVVITNDAQHLVYAANDHQGWQLWRVELRQGAVPDPLTQGTGRTPATAPGDNYIYYTRPHGTGLWRVPITGGAEERLTQAFRFRSRRGWDIGTDGIYFMSTKQGEACVHLLRWGQDTPEEIAVLGPQVSTADIDIHPDGKSVFVTRLDNHQADILKTPIALHSGQ